MPEPACYCSFFAGQPENWKPCSKEHYDMIRASPHERPGYEVRELTVIHADQVLVPIELLKRLQDHIEYDAIGSPSASIASDLADELRALLQS